MNMPGLRRAGEDDAQCTHFAREAGYRIEEILSRR
jgi:hypothetical protein